MNLGLSGLEELDQRGQKPIIFAGPGPVKILMEQIIEKRGPYLSTRDRN
jgi:hypothetical protein